MGCRGPALVVVGVLWYHISVVKSVVKELIKEIKTYPRWPLLAVDGHSWPGLAISDVVEFAMVLSHE